MSKRRFGSIKCLVHFDFPYFNEPNDGLDDDVGIEAWNRENSSVAFWGAEIPKAGTQAPKFGYRCLYPYTGGAVCSNNTGIWNLNSSGDYEIECFVLPKAHGGTRYLLRDNSNTFTVSIDASGYIVVSIPSWGIDSVTSTAALTANSWQHILFRVSHNILKTFINGTEVLSQALTSNVILSINEMRLGYFDNTSYAFFIDEFVFRHSADSKNPTIPTHPYSGYLIKGAIGDYKGYGIVDAASVTVSTKSQLNSYGIINSITDAKTFSVSLWNNGSYPASPGLEIMIHITQPKSTTSANYPLVGLYAFTKIESISGTTVTLDRGISTTNGNDFTLDSSLLSTYYVQAIVVPCFSSLTINSGITVNPLTWGTATGGGIVAFRTTGDCTINGNILTHGKGAIRYDFLQGTNSKLIDRFLCSQGGGIFISCGGTLTIPSSARLGASWSGAGDGSNGAAGKGGGRSYCYSKDSNQLFGGYGGIGGGGSGAVGSYSSAQLEGSNVGSNGIIRNEYAVGGGGCGGSGEGSRFIVASSSAGGGQANSGGSAGTSVEGHSNGNPANGVNGGNYVHVDKSPSIYVGGSGGGGVGGNGGNGILLQSNTKYNILTGGIAGTSIILIAKKLNAAATALSTGGGSGVSSYRVTDVKKAAGASGGGTGFCYIACEKQVN